jgi:poly(A) polymerase
LELAQWWTHFQHGEPGKQKKMLNDLRRQEGDGPKPRKRKRRPASRNTDA